MNKRTIQLIRNIYLNPYNNVEYYAKKMNVSTRSIYNELKLVESCINQYGADFIKQKSLINLHIFDANVFFNTFNMEQNFWGDNYDTSEKRILYILLNLLLDNGSLDAFEMSEIMEVSVSTITKDVALIRKRSKNCGFTITISDYSLVLNGSFEDLLHYFITNIKSDSKINQLLTYLNFDYIVLKKELIHILQRNNIHVFENTIIQFIVAVAIILNSEFDCQDAFVDCSKFHKEVLSLFNVSPNDKRSNIIVNQLRAFSLYLDVDSECSLKSEVFYSELIKYIELNYISDIRSDSKFMNDTYKHILYMLTRYTKNTMVNDGIAKDIKRYFPFSFEIALESIKTVQAQFNYNITSDEIAYFAIHVASHYETVKKSQKNNKLQFKICLVMDVSLHYLLLLKRRLNTLLEKYNIEIDSECLYINFDEEIAKEFDVIITDVPIEYAKDKRIINKLKCTQENVHLLYKEIEVLKCNRFNEVVSYFDKDLFFIDKQINKKELIPNIVNSMEKLGVVNSDFIKSVLKREEYGDTNINEYVAIPHPLGLIANKSKIAICILDDPIEWNDNASVEIVILLAFSKKEIQKMKLIYDVLVEIVSGKNVSKIKKCKSFSQFKELLKEVV